MCLLKLQSQHLWLDHELVERFFQETEQVVVAFVSSGPQLLIAPAPASVLVKVHTQASTRLLKVKNLRGDKTISLYDFLIDNDLPTLDRPLSYDFVEKLGALKVKL